MKHTLVALLTLASAAFAGCATDIKQPEMKNYETTATVRLTVAEGKRLIAKGIAQNTGVRERLANGIIIITRGTTNTYIAEELARLDAPRGAFVTGKIIPAGKADFAKGLEARTEIVLVKGVPTEMSYQQGLDMLQPEDIVFKGANMLNYAKCQIAVNVGAPDGGTVGRLRKYADRGACRWIVPIGLEKETSWDLEQCAAIANGDAERQGTVRLNVKSGDIYTEIEAIREFADVDIFPAAMGGVDGAEGGVSLMLCGSRAEVEKALNAVSGVLGEQPFIR